MIDTCMMSLPELLFAAISHQDVFSNKNGCSNASLRRIEFNEIGPEKTHMITKLLSQQLLHCSLRQRSALFSQEHPEHPSIQSRRRQKQVSTADISAGIKKNITAETNKSDGKFHVKYEGQDLALDLIKVHDDRLQDLGDGKYFACVDMKGTDGKTYDIDFFLTGQPGKMKVTDTAVHKIDGKPLYNWKEENGKWNKVPTS
jgi:hypothetical protein